jgi:hypothetical protein
MSDDLKQQIDPQSIYNRIMEATYTSDDIAQGRNAMALALELSRHITALETRNQQLAEVAREMREFVDHRDMMIDYGDATLAAEKLAAWDTALKAAGQGDSDAREK